MSSALLNKFTCPECSTVLKLANAVAPGKKVKCPKCSAIFEAQAETPTVTASAQDTTTQIPKPAPAPKGAPKKASAERLSQALSAGNGNGKKPAAKNPSKQALSLPLPVDDADDEEEDDDEESSTKKKKKSGKKKIKPIVVQGSIGGSIVAVLLGFLLSWMDSGPDEPAPTEVAQSTEKKDDSPPKEDPAKKDNGTKGSPSSKPASTGNKPLPRPTPKPPPPAAGGSDTSDTLAFLPADSQVVIGLNSVLFDDPQISEFLKNGAQSFAPGKNPQDEIRQKLGIELKDVEAIAVGVKDIKGLAGAEKPTVVVVIKTRQPHESAKVLQAAQAGPAALKFQGRDYYSSSQEPGPKIIYFPTPRHIVFADMTQAEPEKVLVPEGRGSTLPPEFQPVLTRMKDSLGYVVFSMDLVRNNLPPGGVDSVTMGLPPSMQNLAKQALQSRTAAIGLRKSSDRLTLSACLLCENVRAAGMLRQGLEDAWNNEWKPVVLALTEKPGPGQEIIQELMSNLAFHNEDDIVLVEDGIKLATLSKLEPLLAMSGNVSPRPPVDPVRPPVPPPVPNPPVGTQPQPNPNPPPVDPNPKPPVVVQPVDPHKPPAAQVNLQNDPSAANLNKIGGVYSFYVQQAKRAPTKAEDLKAFVAQLVQINPQAESTIGKPEEFLVSPHDMQPYVVHWGVFPGHYLSPPNGPVVLAYEQTGKDGRRIVLLTSGKVESYTEEQMQKARYPRGFKPPQPGAPVAVPVQGQPGTTPPGPAQHGTPIQPGQRQPGSQPELERPRAPAPQPAVAPAILPGIQK
jgi:predicted Zn finger-like uncharacterized protein